MWSLGVILYIMATGVMPFDDTNVTEMLKVQMKNQIKYPRMKYPLSNKLKVSFVFCLLTLLVVSNGVFMGKRVKGNAPKTAQEDQKR